MLTNVDKYILKFANKCGESASGRSHYYQIEDCVVRVSDHIGRNSDGCVQIIVKPNGYLLYYPSTGAVSICSYRQVQEFIRSFSLFPVKNIEPRMLIAASSKSHADYVLGVPKEAFTPGQLDGITKMVKKVQK